MTKNKVISEILFITNSIHYFLIFHSVIIFITFSLVLWLTEPILSADWHTSFHFSPNFATL